MQQSAIILNYSAPPLYARAHRSSRAHTHTYTEKESDAYLLCALFNQFSCIASQHRWACNYFGFCFDKIVRRPCSPLHALGCCPNVYGFPSPPSTLSLSLTHSHFFPLCLCLCLTVLALLSLPAAAQYEKLWSSICLQCGGHGTEGLEDCRGQ